MKRRYDTYRASIEANSKERARFNLPADYPSRPWSNKDIEKFQNRLFTGLGEYNLKRKGKRLEVSDTKSIRCSLIEIQWMRFGLPSVFIETPELFRMLLNCNIDIRYEELFLPVFEDKPPAPPPMAGVDMELMGAVSFAVPAGLEFGSFCVGRSPHVNGNWGYFLMHRLAFGGVMYSTMTNETDLEMELNGKDYPHDTTDVSEKDGICLSNSWRLFAATLLYIKAFPSLIEEGPPGNVAPLERRSIVKASRRVVTVSLSPEMKNSPSPHLRRFHFRTLRAERFRHNPDGTARVVAVRQAVIGNISKTRTAKEPHGFRIKRLKPLDK